MQKEEIIKEIERNYTDEFTINTLINFIESFQNSFNEYLPTEEAIKRLKERINSIILVNDLISKKLDGKYDDENNVVIIYKGILKDTHYFNYLIFHELLHAITIKDLPDNRRMFGFYDLTLEFGNFFNEAMTEWFTKIRNEKEGVFFESGYDAITEQISHLAQIVGEDRLIKTFLYEPEKIRSLLEEFNINFDDIENIFGTLIQKEPDIKHLGNQQKLNNLNNIYLYQKCKDLFDIYSNAIGEINSAEKFKHKYQVLGKYSNNNLNINKIIELHYYSSMYDDLKIAIQNGATRDEINGVLEELGVSFNTIKNYNNYKEMFSQGKNQSAIQLYKLFAENPDKYYKFAFQNYAFLFEHFSETDLLPTSKSLYNVDKYAMIGKFLAEHANYEYDEVSTTKMVTNNGIVIYSFKTSDNKKFLYTLPNCPVELIGQNNFRIYFENGNIDLNLQDGINFDSKNRSRNPVIVKFGYSEDSQLENIEYCMNLEELSQEEKNTYTKKSEILRKKIQDNRSQMK